MTMSLKPITILAAKSGGFSDAITSFPEQADLLDFCTKMGPGLAALMIIVGIVYLLFGFPLHKMLVLVNAAVVGFVAGGAVGEKSGASLPCALGGAVLAAALAWPWMKWTVSVMGCLYGALAAATIWRLTGQDPKFTWAGAMTGFVAGGLMCFILYNGCVMAYMSLQGAVMVAFGALGLMMKYKEVAPKVDEYLGLRPFVLPLAVFVPTVLGTMFQRAGMGGAPKPAAPKK
ncbi:MAG TPA: hypothetical protein VF796_00470 [Humisphaera sp.]